MNPVLAGSLVTGATDIIGGLIGSSGQRSANRANLQIARENRQWQERMSNTAYTRAARDLEQAGLNRILALGKPATTPPGNIATMQNPKAALGQATSRAGLNAVNTAMAVKRNQAEVANIESTTELNKKRTDLVAIQQIIAKHGETVAAVAADIVRTVRALIGNKSPEEAAEIIRNQIDKAKNWLTNAMESMSGQTVPGQWQSVRDDITQFVLDQVMSDPNPPVSFNLDPKSLRPEDMELYQYYYNVAKRQGWTAKASREYAIQKVRKPN